jgi:hypothetical protein
MDIESLLRILMPILTIAFGALSAYLRTNEMIRNSSIKYITEAEEMYKDVTKAGGQKFAWVVDTLYNLVPQPLRVLVTRKCIEKIVQSTFDGIEEYAKTQLDKAIEKYISNLTDNNESENVIKE